MHTGGFSDIPTELIKKLHKTLNLNELAICYRRKPSGDDGTAREGNNAVRRFQPPRHISKPKVVNLRDPGQILFIIDTRGELAASTYR